MNPKYAVTGTLRHVLEPRANAVDQTFIRGPLTPKFGVFFTDLTWLDFNSHTSYTSPTISPTTTTHTPTHQPTHNNKRNKRKKSSRFVYLPTYFQTPGGCYNTQTDCGVHLVSPCPIKSSHLLHLTWHKPLSSCVALSRRFVRVDIS